MQRESQAVSQMGQELYCDLDGHLDSDAPSVDFDPGFGWLHHGKAGWHTLKGTPVKKEHGAWVTDTGPVQIPDAVQARRGD